ncbi:MAG: YbhB/YbcL family Raf kinase inhibitor-like protein [Polyangiaceae bacterium]
MTNSRTVHRVALLAFVSASLAIGTACSTKGVTNDAGTEGDAAVDANTEPTTDANAPDASPDANDASKDGGGGDASTDARSDANTQDASDASDAAPDVAPAAFTLQTSAFAEGTAIPAIHACNAHQSPALTWTAGPTGTMGYAVVMIDKTRIGTNDEVHWVLFDIPAATLSLAQAVARSANPGTPAGSKQVLSFDGLPGYFGPCPPIGDAAHVYEFRVYAMNTNALGNVTTATNKQTAAANVAQAAIGVTNAVSGTYAR